MVCAKYFVVDKIGHGSGSVMSYPLRRRFCLTFGGGPISTQKVIFPWLMCVSWFWHVKPHRFWTFFLQLPMASVLCSQLYLSHLAWSGLQSSITSCMHGAERHLVCSLVYYYCRVFMSAIIRNNGWHTVGYYTFRQLRLVKVVKSLPGIGKWCELLGNLKSFQTQSIILIPYLNSNLHMTFHVRSSSLSLWTKISGLQRSIAFWTGTPFSNAVYRLLRLYF